MDGSNQVEDHLRDLKKMPSLEVLDWGKINSFGISFIWSGRSNFNHFTKLNLLGSINWSHSKISISQVLGSHLLCRFLPYLFSKPEVKFSNSTGLRFVLSSIPTFTYLGSLSSRKLKELYHLLSTTDLIAR